LLSLPRDLWVEIPGNGSGKINGAYSLGGASLLVETVRGVTGLDINHYVEVDFAGFQAIVDQLGGVEIEFDNPARDVKSGLDVSAGLQVLDGDEALAYARSRSYQELQDERWVSVDADDFGRTNRQQALIVAILERMKRPSSITEAGSIVGSFSQHVTMDAALANSSLIELAFGMRGIRGSNIESITLPGVTDTVSSQSVVVPDEPEASAVLEAFRTGASLAVAAGETDLFSLIVLNGNGLAGSATEWSDVLDEAGFVVDDVGDAENSEYRQTLVTVRLGEEGRGEEIISALGFGRVEAGDVPDDVDAVVVLGADAAGVAG
jgi:LCP family protein required for cell wall assembly